jgi:hypothetical protein
LIQAAVEAGERAAQAGREKQAAQEKRKQELLAAHPELEPGAGAKNLRKQLKAAFPGVKFSVRSDHNSVCIGWEDGPTEDDVQQITRPYKAGHFDGMDDCYHYDRDRAWPFGDFTYVFENRGISEASRIALKAAIAETYRDMHEWDQDREHHQIFCRTSLPVGHAITGITLPEGAHEFIATHEKTSQPATDVAH